MQTIFLIRHGQSTFNEAYAATGQDPGHIDARLTKLGQAQARQVAARLDNVDLDLVVVSPLTRALQTAHLAFGHRELPFEVTCRHRERLESSCDVGRSPAMLAEDFPHLGFDHLNDPWWHHDPSCEGPFVTEPHAAFLARVEAFSEWLRTHPAPRIAVVGHGTFFHAMLGRWLANGEVAEWSAA